MKEQNTPPASKASGNRPGQRQQERLQRLARRRKRQQKVISVIVAIILIAASVALIVQYVRYTNDQAQIASQHEAATANAQNAHATATVQTQASIPAPDNPPVVNAQPVTQPDGLQYIDIKEGTGSPAETGSTLSVIYTGWLQSTGQKFDSTYDDGRQPFSVTLGQGRVIPGWEEGLVGVKVGGTRRLIIPGALAYGEQGSSQGKVTIPPNATLIFDVTVVSIQ
jgi:FKBP-type peptidyl-prolyl cis-trans isomerase